MCHHSDDSKNSAKAEYDGFLSINQVRSGCPKYYIIAVNMDDETVPREVDSGAARSIINQKHFQELQAEKHLFSGRTGDATCGLETEVT